MIKLTFLRKFLLIIHTNQKSEIFFIAAIFLINASMTKFQSYVSSRCHDLLMMSMKFRDLHILNIEILIIAALLAELANMGP